MLFMIVFTSGIESLNLFNLKVLENIYLSLQFHAQEKNSHLGISFSIFNVDREFDVVFSSTLHQSLISRYLMTRLAKTGPFSYSKDGAILVHIEILTF